MAYITGSATNISKPISTNSPSVSTGGSIRSTPSAPYSALRATSPHRLTQNSTREIGDTPHVVAVGDNRIGMVCCKLPRRECHLMGGGMTQSLTERYDERISGVLSCYDRVVITGTLPVICYAEGMTRFLYAAGIRIFDYPHFAQTLRDRMRDRAASLAFEAGVSIEHIAKSHVRKEEVVARVLAQRSDHSGLVHIISAMEACDSYRPWHDKATGKTFVRPDSGKCLHYYLYFMDAELGLIYLRVPTWCPFRLRFYCNGHNWLARKLTAEGIGYSMADNAFTRIDDWDRAQDLADELSPDALHETLDRYADQCCPVSEEFGQSYHWSLMQVEYATDLVLRSRATLGPLCDQVIRETVLGVIDEQVATFLGRQITPQLAQEIGSQ